MDERKEKNTHGLTNEEKGGNVVFYGGGGFSLFSALAQVPARRFLSGSDATAVKRVQLRIFRKGET